MCEYHARAGGSLETSRPKRPRFVRHVIGDVQSQVSQSDQVVRGRGEREHPVECTYWSVWGKRLGRNALER